MTDAEEVRIAQGQCPQCSAPLELVHGRGRVHALCSRAINGCDCRIVPVTPELEVILSMLPTAIPCGHLRATSCQPYCSKVVYQVENMAGLFRRVSLSRQPSPDGLLIAVTPKGRRVGLVTWSAGNSEFGFNTTLGDLPDTTEGGVL